MSFHTLPGIIIATGLLASATASGVYTLNARRTLVNPDRMARSAKVSDAFTCSKAVHELANPRQHQATTDTRSITIDIPPHHRQVSDQVLLASFVKGFFGGLVFGPERVALQTLGPKLVNYPDAPPQKTTWSMEDLSETQLPALNTVLFGSFQVLDVQLSGADDRGVDAPQSYIDFGSGNPAGGFAGVHRFVITRTKNTSEAARVEIHFESMACNPTVDKPFAPLFVHRLHNLYADLLFRDAIFHVEQGLKQ